MEEDEADEKQKLEQANLKLRQELELLKQRVEELRENRFVEDDDTEEALLLSLENELLRNQLLEQQQFLEGCRTLLIEQPLESEETRKLKRELMKQGSENALTHLLHIVSRSQQNQNWSKIKLPEHFFKNAVPGLNVTACYKREAESGDNPDLKSLILRVDACFPNVDPDVAAQGYWSTWVNAEMWSTAFKDFFTKPDDSSKKIKVDKEHIDDDINFSKTPIPFALSEIMSSKEEDGSEVGVHLYREYPLTEGSNPRDWVYVSTRQKRDIAMSTLTIAADFTPTVAARRDQHSRRVIHETSKPKRKRPKGTGSTSAAHLVGKQTCWVLARNSMQSVNAHDMEAKNSSRVDEGSKLVEGLFVWQDVVSIDREVPCPEGEEIRREKIPAARAAAFIYIHCDLFPVQETQIHDAIVDLSGKSTDRFAKLVDMYYSITGGAFVQPSSS